ncbi:hypothetical protein TIFTF001_017861 [Ficus carica]|uniref:Uncharacterized protein n=1 Tax=Ficus carica TaxID=3494 RepID=A0AA88DB53_FICCA|nr:hypothetical protein TIFTF001_017861 [Ficus carica]
MIAPAFLSLAATPASRGTTGSPATRTSRRWRSSCLWWQYYPSQEQEFRAAQRMMNRGFSNFWRLMNRRRGVSIMRRNFG